MAGDIQRRMSLPLVVVAAAVVGALTAGIAIEAWFGAPGSLAPAGQSRAEDLPVPRGSDLSLARARTLAAGGHLPDALRALDSIGLYDSRRAESDHLRAELQARLLALSGVEASDAGGGR